MDEMNGFEFELVWSHDMPEFKCPICFFLMKQTVELPCSHSFCSSCLQQWEESSANQSEKLSVKKCPMCQTVYESDKIHLSRQIDRIITTSLQVKCQQHILSCQWMGTISSYFEVHETTCPYKKLECENVGCNVMTMRRVMEEHLLICQYREITCSFCMVKVAHKDLQAHHNESCKEIPMECINEGCMKTFPRRLMSSHFMNDCPQTEVACSFQYIGCNEKIKRHELQNHLDNTTSHTSLLLHEMLNMKSRIAVLESENATLKKECTQLNSTVLQEKHHRIQLQNRISELAKKHDYKVTMMERDIKDLSKKQKEELTKMCQRIKPLEKNTKSTPNTTTFQDIEARTSQQQQQPEVEILSEEERKNRFDELRQLLQDKEEDQFIAIVTLKPHLLNLCNSSNSTLLHRASCYGLRKCTEYLLQRGLDPFSKDTYGDMPIHDASRNGHTDVINVLLKANPFMVNETGRHGQTPLRKAVLNNHEDAVKLLISHPAIDLNIRDYDGKLVEEYSHARGSIKQIIRRKLQER